MDRRSSLSTLLGRKKQIPNHQKTGTKQQSAAAPLLSGLDPYTGPWNYEQAAHLLRRCTFGATHAQIKEVVQNGLADTIDTLLAELPLPAPPLNFKDADDPNVPIGETWVNAPYSSDEERPPRRQSLYAWTMELILEEGISIREKMVLFWHNHFVVESASVNDGKFLYDYSNTLRTHVLGNFKDFVKAITINPAMLRYLNGRQNSKFAPNENYARELLELFTIGKGDLAGPGDYTTFTEDDVAEIARVLTGWRDTGYYATEEIPVSAVYINNRHDVGSKQLSHRFDNVVIENAGDQEYANLIDIIFQQDEVARFICRKLYRWFVYYNIDETVESNIIEPMAQLLIDNNYEIKPVLAVLLSSDHFFDPERIGCMIKHPLDFVFGVLNQFEVSLPEELNPRFNLLLNVSRFLPSFQMEYYNPPNVAGWKAYYQAPVFYQIWLNSVTLPIRMEFSARIVTPGYVNGALIIDALEFLTTLDEPSDINLLIDDLVRILLPKGITENQRVFLKEVLIPGLPDYEWNVEYSEYASDPGNVDLAEGVRNKVRNLLTTMLTMSEYQLS